MFPTPCSPSLNVMNFFRENWYLSLLISIKNCLFLVDLSTNILKKSDFTSYELCPIHGPIEQFILLMFAPRSFILDRVFSIIPFRAPFQPAWQAPIIDFFWSKNKIGAQSAVRTDNIIFWCFVTIPSHLYSVCWNLGSTILHMFECVWCIVINLDLGRLKYLWIIFKLSSTNRGLSFDPLPQFSDEYFFLLKPPILEKKQWSTSLKFFEKNI